MTEEDMSYHPHTKPAGDGELYCFKDQGRVCGPDCMAFDTPPASQEFQGKPWARCKLLVDSHRGGKHLVIIAECLHSVRTFIDDSKRINQAPPMKVR